MRRPATTPSTRSSSPRPTARGDSAAITSSPSRARRRSRPTRRGSSPSFLRDELENRLRTGPAAFRLLLQVAAEGDPTDDPSALWPADRPRVELGRLEVTGISLSNDPILLARSAAYAISYERRSKGE